MIETEKAVSIFFMILWMVTFYLLQRRIREKNEYKELYEFLLMNGIYQ